MLNLYNSSLNKKREAILTRSGNNLTNTENEMGDILEDSIFTRNGDNLTSVMLYKGKMVRYKVSKDNVSDCKDEKNSLENPQKIDKNNNLINGPEPIDNISNCSKDTVSEKNLISNSSLSPNSENSLSHLVKNNKCEFSDINDMNLSLDYSSDCISLSDSFSFSPYLSLSCHFLGNLLNNNTLFPVIDLNYTVFPVNLETSFNDSYENWNNLLSTEEMNDQIWHFHYYEAWDNILLLVTEQVSEMRSLLAFLGSVNINISYMMNSIINMGDNVQVNNLLQFGPTIDYLYQELVNYMSWIDNTYHPNFRRIHAQLHNSLLDIGEGIRAHRQGELYFIEIDDVFLILIKIIRLNNDLIFCIINNTHPNDNYE